MKTIFKVTHVVIKLKGDSRNITECKSSVITSKYFASYDKAEDFLLKYWIKQRNMGDERDADKLHGELLRYGDDMNYLSLTKLNVI